METLTPSLGARIRVVERGGTQLQSILSNNKPWKGARCGRTDCHPCVQPGEKVKDCRSLKERAGEHQTDYAKEGADSHMMKHWTVRHQGSPPPPFQQVVARMFRTSLA